MSNCNVIVKCDSALATRCGVSIHVRWPHASQWCNTGCHGCLMITEPPEAELSSFMTSWSLIMLSSQWLEHSLQYLDSNSWSDLKSASQLATYLLKCIHKLNRGNYTHHNNSRKLCPPPPLAQWPSHWMFASDGWLQSSLYLARHYTIAHDPITASHPQYRCHVPRGALATDMCTCPTCPPANAHNWLWWKGDDDKITQKLRGNSVHTHSHYPNHICFESS